MRENWYYAQGAECVGPISKDDLVAILSKVPGATEVPVWRDGFSDWKAAGLVSELASHILNAPLRAPPPVSTASNLSDLLLGDGDGGRITRSVKPVQERTKSNSRFNNFIARHWRGELPLWVSYWIVGFLINFAALLFMTFVADALTADSGYNPIRIFSTLSAIWLGIVAITIWQLVGVWRSANNYIAQKVTQNKTGAWGGLAKLAVILGVLRSIVYFVQSGYPQIEATAKMAFMNDPTLPNYALRIMRNGTEIEISGGIKYGLNDEFVHILNAAPGVRIVQLNSLGGRIGEAVKLYETIKSRNLDTYTSSGCYSACTIAYIAGHERWLNQYAKLGFHAPAFPGMSREDLLAAVEDQRRIMVAAGIPASFISRALTTASNSMWYPSIEELLKANVVTGIADQNKFAEWAVYQPTGVGYSIEMPGEWKIENGELKTAAGPVKTVTAIVADPARAYMTMYCSYPEAFVRAKVPDVMLDGARDGAVKNTNGTLRSERRIVISNIPARYVIIDAPDDVVLAAIIVMVGNNLAMANVAGPQGVETEPATLRFFRSLQIGK